MKKSRVIPYPADVSSGTGTELKCIDTVWSTRFFGTSLTSSVPSRLLPVKFIPMPASGTSVYARVAGRTRGVSLQVRGYVGPDGANSYYRPQYLRFMVIYDRQTNGAQPSVEEILRQPDLEFFPTSFANPSNRDRFLVLLDKSFVVAPADASWVAPPRDHIVFPAPRSLMVEEEIDLKGIETHFIGSGGGTVSSVMTGGYFMVCFADCAEDVVDPYLFFGSIRYNFYD